MRRHLTTLALLAAVCLVGAACGETRDTGFPPESPTKKKTGESPSPTASGPVELSGPIDVADNEFKPKEVKVKAGTKVVWKQSGIAPHTVTSDDDAFDSHKDCSFSKSDQCLNQGDEYARTFSKAGRVPYYCRLHGAPGGAGMAGVIVVEA